MESTSQAPDDRIGALTRDLLAWLERAPRTYTETMEAWRSHCPRLSIWEDALADGLVRVVLDRSTSPAREIVVVTDEGRAAMRRGVTFPQVETRG